MCFQLVQQLFHDFRLGPATVFKPVVEAASWYRLPCRLGCAETILGQLTHRQGTRFTLPRTPVVVEQEMGCTFLWDGEQDTPVGLDCRRLFLVCLRDDMIRATFPSYGSLKLTINTDRTRPQPSTYLLLWGVWGPLHLAHHAPGEAKFSLGPVGGVFFDPLTGVEVNIERAHFRERDCQLIGNQIISAVDTVLNMEAI